MQDRVRVIERSCDQTIEIVYLRRIVSSLSKLAEPFAFASDDPEGFTFTDIFVPDLLVGWLVG